MSFLKSKIISAVRQWQEKRFLAKYGCSSIREYKRRYDTDCNLRATRVKDFYHGYPYVHCFENQNHAIYTSDIDFDGLFVIDKWIEQNCVGKNRFDFLRVVRAPSTDNEWEINELGGGDYIFVAFKEQQDYIWFMLRWG